MHLRRALSRVGSTEVRGGPTVSYPFTTPNEDHAMAYGKKSAITGTKLGNHGKGGGGFKLHSDMKLATAKGHKSAPKMSRKSL